MVGSGVWVVVEVSCWLLEIASVWVQRGHGEIGVGHDVGHRMVGWFFWVSNEFFLIFLL